MSGVIETVRLTIQRPKKISMAHLPISVPPTPPELAPGIQYLDGSPFQGTKTIKFEPTGDPYDLDIVIPLRNERSSWHTPTENPVGTIKTPSAVMTVEAKDSRPAGSETVTDTTTRWWEETVTQVPEGTIWPPTVDDFSYPTGVSLDTLVNEDLSTGLWAISRKYNIFADGYSEYAFNRSFASMDLTDPHFNVVKQPLIPVYSVTLFLSTIQYLHCVEPDGGTHWHPCSIAQYDKRADFMSRIQNPGGSSFFTKLQQQCASKTAINTILTKMNESVTNGTECTVFLTFFRDPLEITDDDKETPGGSLVPINGRRHYVVKLRKKDYSYDCSGSFYRYVPADQH